MQRHHDKGIGLPLTPMQRADPCYGEARGGDYCLPQLYVIGEAVDLLQGGNCGAYWDYDQGSRCRTTE